VTKFDFYRIVFCSPFASLTASVIQGSALGPSLFATTAADLKPITPGNKLTTFADDIYLLVPAINSDSCRSELDHIEQWATHNNLTLNRAKSQEIVFSSRPGKFQIPPLLPCITRVETLLCLGVTLSATLSFSDHVSRVISMCNQSLFALRSLRHYGLDSASLNLVFKATSLARLLYCSPAGGVTAPRLTKLA
jgi:hypothetical protein